MKILLVINSLQIGGAETQVIADANMLVKNNEVYIYYSGKGDLVENLNDNVLIIKAKKNNLLYITIDLLRITKKYNIDFVFAHMYWAQKSIFLSTLFNRNLKTYFFDHGLNLWKGKIHIMLTHIIAFKAEAIIVVSEAKRKIKIEKENFKYSKVQLIHNCFKQSVEIDESKIILPDIQDKFTIGFVGRFSSVKQLDILIDVAKILLKSTNNFRFILVGDGPEMSEIKNQIKDNNLEMYFITTGFVLDPLSYMRTFNVFILPSIREDLSVALMEAGSVGLPSIAFDVGGNKEIIIDGETGFIIPPFNLDIFAAKILEFIKNEDLVIVFGINAKKRIFDKFSSKKRIDNLNELIYIQK